MRRQAVAMVALMMLAGLLGVAQAADDANPTGTWKWSVMRGDQPAIEQTLRLKLEDGKLSGAMVGRNNRETAIEDAKYEDGTVSFKVKREQQGQTVTSAYKGKVSGDTIKGTISSDRGGQTRERQWEAKRAS